MFLSLFGRVLTSSDQRGCRLYKYKFNAPVRKSKTVGRYQKQYVKTNRPQSISIERCGNLIILVSDGYGQTVALSVLGGSW